MTKILPYDPERARRVEAMWKKIDQEEREKALHSLELRSLQIPQVDAEFVRDDLGLEFDSERMERRCRSVRLDPKTYQRVRDWSSRRGFYLVGPSGSGKTSLSKAFALRLKRSRAMNSPTYDDFVKFVNFGKALDGMKNDEFKYRQSIVENMRRCEVLFLDDLGTEKYSEFTEKVLYELLEERHKRQMPEGSTFKTFFTSNVPINKLPYHERVVRRLSEMIYEVEMR